MLSKNAQKIFDLKYRIGDEDWAKTCWRVASYIAQAEKEENRKEYEKKYFELIYNLAFLPGGRIIANAGTNIKNLLNCFVLPVEDSREGIYTTLKNAAEVFAHGGGIGYNFSNLREEGAEIRSTGGNASGPLSFMSLFDQTGEVIQQASRRGAQMGILDIDHPDIEKFISFKSKLNKRNERLLDEFYRNTNGDANKTILEILNKTLADDQLTHFNISVAISDEFIKAVLEDKDWDLISRSTKEVVKTIKAKELLKQIAEMSWASGDPGVFFLDRSEEDNMVKYLGELKATNPCVTGDTKILTVYEGKVPIKDLVGRDILVYSWSSETKLPAVRMMSNIRKTRENVEILEIEFDSGLKVKCTPDHNFIAFRGYKIKAKDLTEGQSIRAFSGSIHKDEHLRVHGWVDGKAKHQYVARMIWEYFNGPIEEGLILHHKDFDPMNNSMDNLELVTHAMHNSIHYPYRLTKGFFFNETKDHALKRAFPENHKVISIKPAGFADVYNGVVDETHTYIIPDETPISGDFSGIVSANCGEVPLLPYEPCCLGSINLHKFYDEKTNSIDFEFLEYVVRLSVRFLDNVQELTTLPIEEINTWSRGLRRLGLGVMGWADLLAELEIPYDSKDALNLATYLSWFISFFSWLESIELANERGAFPFYDKEKVDFYLVEKTLNSKLNPYHFDIEKIKEGGVRNVAITSIAPTGTISLLSGVNSGIEPFFALAYKRNITEGVGNTAKDFIIEINPILEKKLKKYEVSESDIEEIKNHVLKFGSLDGCEKIPKNILPVFYASHEISPESHVEMQSAWQTFVDNSISKTINLPQTATVKDIEDIIIFMWNNNLKGGTLYRDNSKKFQILNKGT